jgi:hypothetical protein
MGPLFNFSAGRKNSNTITLNIEECQREQNVLTGALSLAGGGLNPRWARAHNGFETVPFNHSHPF